MTLNTSLHAEHQLDQLAGQFVHWRQTRPHPRARIPQALWEQAVALARVMPHSRVAQHLRLSSNALKKQMATPPHEPPPAVPSRPLGFVEVPSASPRSRPSLSTQVELHRADGTRLCIHAPASTLPLDALVRAFLEVR
jgi:hypothetical protein